MKREYKLVKHWDGDKCIYYTVHQKFFFFFRQIGGEFDCWKDACDALYRYGLLDDEEVPVN